VKLDSYVGNISASYVGKLEKLPKGHGKFQDHGGHAYYSFPVGTAVFSVPFVWLARLQGKDLLDVATDEASQRLLSALSCAIVFLLILSISRHFLPFFLSYMFSLIMLLCSPLISTMGSALWSSVYAVVFAFAALLMLVRARFDSSNPNPWVLALLLFSATLCRPTLAVFLILVVGYTFSVHRPVAMSVTGLVIVQILLFAGWSLKEFGQPLPPYYRCNPVAWIVREPAATMLFCSLLLAIVLGGVLHRRGKRRLLLSAIYVLLLVSVIAVLSTTPGVTSAKLSRVSIMWRILEAINGILFSPARGLFVYHPVLLLALPSILAILRRMLSDRLFWLMTLWILLHLLIISRPFWWHGGHCYGSRLFIEAIPGITVLTLVAIDRGSLLKWMRSPFAKILIVGAGLFGAFVNSYQGLYNVHTAAWNTSPNVDSNTEYLFSWKFPQFLASPNLNAAKTADCERKMAETARIRHRRALEDRMATYSAFSVGEFIPTDGKQAVFERLDNPQMEVSDNPLSCDARGSRVWFRLATEQLHSDSVALEFDAAAQDPVRLLVSVNGISVDEIALSGTDRRTYSTSFPAIYLQRYSVESIQFEVLEHDQIAADPTAIHGDDESVFQIWQFRILDGPRFPVPPLPS
jgi:hypothetical protein